MAHVVEDEADEEVERYAEEVDDGGAHLLRNVLRTHLHHARPEETHHHLEQAERPQLYHALHRDACKAAHIITEITGINGTYISLHALRTMLEITN